MTEAELRSLVFCDFGDAKSDVRNYEEVQDVEQLQHVVENYLDEFNNASKKPMHLVMFRSVVNYTLGPDLVKGVNEGREERRKGGRERRCVMWSSCGTWLKTTSMSSTMPPRNPCTSWCSGLK